MGRDKRKDCTCFGQKQQDFLSTLSCCGLGRTLSPSALPCWRMTPASFHQNHRAPSIKGARPKRPAVHFLVRLSVQATNSWEGNSGVICMPKILRKKQQLTPETAGLALLLAPRARMFCMIKSKSIDSIFVNVNV